MMAALADAVAKGQITAGGGQMANWWAFHRRNEAAAFRESASNA